MENHRLIDTIDKLWPEVLGNGAHDLAFHIVIVIICHILNDVRTQVRGHDDHGITEINRAALTVSKPSIIQHLQQDVEDIRMRLFDLVKK